MTPDSLLSNRIADLRQVVQRSFESANEQTKGFALRILGNDRAGEYLPGVQFDLVAATKSASYGGVPTAAYLGYGIGDSNFSDSTGATVAAFEAAIERLRSRSSQGLAELVDDDIALLGVADGLAGLNQEGEKDKALRSWLVRMAESRTAADMWSTRVRALAAELLEGRGRLHTRLPNTDLPSLALDLCLRNRWLQPYRQSPMPDRTIQQAVMRVLLMDPAPEVGDLERSVIWLMALDLLAQQAVLSLVPSISDTARLLYSTQSAFKRWVWEENARRKSASPARWLIDNEYHVQSFLWAVLYPIFGEQLCDETYLPGYGLLQPRADIGILSLKLIIEVKILRQRSDFEAIEEEIAGDLGIYFSDLNRFDRMIAYIYDDCDTHHPELYKILGGALRQRDPRMEEVVIVRRPSMIPRRSARKI